MPNPILVPIDFSECSDRAFEGAMALARQTREPLLLLHVVQPPRAAHLDALVSLDLIAQLCHSAEAALAKYGQRAQEQGVHAELRVEEGAPSACIPRVAGEQNAHMIVMGTHGVSGLRRALLGSVAERTLRTAECPVLTVRESMHLADSEPVCLLVPTDFSETARAAFDAAQGLATQLGKERVRIILINVQQVMVEHFELALHDREGLERQLLAYAKAELAKLEAELAESGIATESFTRLGGAGEIIVQAAAATHADLIVQCTHGRTGFSRLGIGSVAEKVARTAECAVLTVPAARSETTADVP